MCEWEIYRLDRWMDEWTDGWDMGEMGMYRREGGHRCKAGTEGGKEARKGVAGSWKGQFFLFLFFYSPFSGQRFLLVKMRYETIYWMCVAVYTTRKGDGWSRLIIWNGVTCRMNARADGLSFSFFE